MWKQSGDKSHLCARKFIYLLNLWFSKNLIFPFWCDHVVYLPAIFALHNQIQTYADVSLACSCGGDYPRRGHCQIEGGGQSYCRWQGMMHCHETWDLWGRVLRINWKRGVTLLKMARYEAQPLHVGNMNCVHRPFPKWTSPLDEIRAHTGIHTDSMSATNRCHINWWIAKECKPIEWMLRIDIMSIDG